MDLINIITGGGPYVLAAVMGYLYSAERIERREAQAKLDEVYSQFTERLINALNAASQSTRDVTSAMQMLNNTFQTVMMKLGGTS